MPKRNILKAALTELPILVRVSWALCTRSSPTLTAKALVIWEENSTEIPTAMTKLTNETAFNVMFHLKMNKKNRRRKIAKKSHFLRMYIPVHHSAKIDENHHDHNQTDEGRGKVKSHHEKGHHENGNQGYSQ